MATRWKRLVLVMLTTLVMAGSAGGDTLDSKAMFGVHEKVHIKELDITLPAKLDTGAQSASLSATYIKVFKEDGRRMVEFDLAVDKSDREKWNIDKNVVDDIRLPLDSHVRIKRRAENSDTEDKSYSRRPVVELTLCVGGRQATVEVNLTDRRDFRYPLLVGSDALRALNAVVDPSISMRSGSPECAGEAS